MAVAVLAVGACGGSEERLTREELAARGDALCTEVDDRFDQAFRETGLPRDDDLTPEQVQSFVKKIVPILDETIDKFEDLEPPKDLEQQYDAALAQARKDYAKVAAAAETPEGAESLLNNEEDPFAETNRKFEAVGITECSDDDAAEGGEPNGTEGEASTTTSAP